MLVKDPDTIELYSQTPEEVDWAHNVPKRYAPCPVCGYNRGHLKYESNKSETLFMASRKCDQCGWSVSVSRPIVDCKRIYISDRMMHVCWNESAKNYSEELKSDEFIIPWIINKSNGKKETYYLYVNYKPQ